MLISFCLSTYNRYNYLKYTIDTILNQFDKKNIEYEIVVCDSGSTDGTIEYLESIKKVRMLNISFFGLAKSYIYAFKNAKGKFIVNINDHMYLNIKNILRCVNDLNRESEIGCILYSLAAYGYGINNRHPFELPDTGRTYGLLMHHSAPLIQPLPVEYIGMFWRGSGEVIT